MINSMNGLKESRDSMEKGCRMATFGERLRELRDERLLTQDELAKEIGVTKNTVFVWEKDKRMPDEDYDIDQIAEFFDVSLGYLLGFSDDRRRPSDHMTDEEAAEAARVDEIEDIRYAIKIFCDLSPEMKKMIWRTLASAYQIDKERNALLSQQPPEDLDGSGE